MFEKSNNFFVVATSHDNNLAHVSESTSNLHANDQQKFAFNSCLHKGNSLYPWNISTSENCLKIQQGLPHNKHHQRYVSMHVYSAKIDSRQGVQIESSSF